MPLKLHGKYIAREMAEALNWPFPGDQHGVWQHGAIHRSDGVLLRVTLDKSGNRPEYRYADRFLSPTLLLWKSQLTVRPESSKGLDYIAGRKPLHLFVRKRKLNSLGAAAPHVYLGTVHSAAAGGSRPLTVTWKLDNPVPAVLWSEFMVPIEPPASRPLEFDEVDESEKALDGVVELAEAVTGGDFRVDDRWAPAKIRAAGTIFRALIIERFGGKCALCPVDDVRLLDAAHIVPWAEAADARLNPANGLLLCALHHRAWDRGLLAVSPNGDIEIRASTSAMLEWLGPRRTRLDKTVAKASAPFLQRRQASEAVHS